MAARPCILFVANSCWNLYNFRQGLIRHLAAVGYEVWVAAPADQYRALLSELPIERVVLLPQLRPQGYTPWHDLRLLATLWRLYRSRSFAMVFHFTIKPNIYGSIAARLAVRSSVATITGLGYTFMHSNWRNRLVVPLYRFAFRGVQHVFFHNADDREEFLQRAIVRAGQSSVVGGSGIDVEYFHPQPRTRETGFIFLFIGRLLHSKGIVEFAEAARMVKQQRRDVQFRVAGEIPEEAPDALPPDQLDGWVREGLVQHLGHCDDVREVIRGADVLVLPSYREGVPRALLEGMAMALPIISTQAAGCRDTVDEGENGLLVPVGDAAALADAMLKLCDATGAQLEAMGAHSREKVLQQFSEAQVFLVYEAVLFRGRDRSGMPRRQEGH